jgi:phenylacetate-CoA ligase
VTPSGARIGRLDHIFKDMVEVRNAQICQPERGRVVIRVVKGRGYDVPESEETLLKEARKRLGGDIDIEIEYRSELPRTNNGKIRFVISDIESMQIL